MSRARLAASVCGVVLSAIKGELDREHKRAEKKGQAAVAKFFKAIKVAGKGADVSIEATAPTADLPTILPAL